MFFLKRKHVLGKTSDSFQSDTLTPWVVKLHQIELLIK